MPRMIIDGWFAGVGRGSDPVVFAVTVDGKIQAVGLDGRLFEPFPIVAPDDEGWPSSYSANSQHAVASLSVGESSWLEVVETADNGHRPGDWVATITLEGRGLASAVLAPADELIAALVSPDVFAPYRSAVVVDFDGSIVAEGPLPTPESFAGGLDFDGRYVVAPLESGRIYVLDALTDVARVVEVYAEVSF